MKKIFHLVALFAALSMLTTACSNNGNNTNTTSSGSEGGTTAVTKPSTTEPDITYKFDGAIDLENWTPGQECTITFSDFPRTLEGLKKAQEEIGKRPEGAVLLRLFAMEIYLHNYASNRSEGEACMKLVNTEVNQNSAINTFKGKCDSKDQYYYGPYQVASYLKGATALNAYKADKPFSITVRASKTQPQESTFEKGIVYSLAVLCHGVDNDANGGSWRGVAVVKGKGQPYYKVNSSSINVQVQPVSFKTDDEYVDICTQ